MEPLYKGEQEACGSYRWSVLSTAGARHTIKFYLSPQTSQEVSILEEILCDRFAIICSAIELAGLQALVCCLNGFSSSGLSIGQNMLVDANCALRCVRVSYGGQKWSFSAEACHPILTVMAQSFSYGCITG